MLFNPFLPPCFHFVSPENIRKPMFQGFNGLITKYNKLKHVFSFTDFQNYCFIVIFLYFLFRIFEPLALARMSLHPSFHPSILPSVFSSFCLSGDFLGIAWLVFSKFWHGARNPYEIVCDRAGFSSKNFFALKVGKMGHKWAKNRVFWIY